MAGGRYGRADQGRPVVRWPRRRRLAVAAVASLVLLPVLLAGTGFAVLVAENTGSVPATIPAAGPDDLWLGHAWVGDGRSAADLDTLAARLRQTGIRELFAHVGPLADNGSLNPALRPRARWLLAGLHHLVPGVRVLAWVGDRVGPGPRARGPFDPEQAGRSGRLSVGRAWLA
jgi:hypothetical protein